MNARAQRLRAEAAAWEKANAGWAKGIPGDAFPAMPYITPGAPDPEPYDLRRAVPEPPVGRDGLPVLGEPPRVRSVKFSVFDAVAPAPLLTDEDLAERISDEEIADAMEARRTAIRAWAMAEYSGAYPEILDLLMRRQSIAQIAEATGYTQRHVLNIVRGNPDRPNAGGGLVAWLAIFLQMAWQADVPISVEPVRTKKSVQKQASMGQLAWGFDDLMGVTA